MGKLLTSIAIILTFTAGEARGAVELQRTGSAKPNTQKGYDFYDRADKIIARSIQNKQGGFNYYDARGNLTGSLRRPDKKKKDYTYYDSYGIARGTLKWSPSGTYRYKDNNTGRLVDSVPPILGKIGSLSPDAFRGTKSTRE